MKIKELEDRFREKSGSSQEEQVIRNTLLRVAIDFNNFIPESDKKSEVISKLEELKNLAVEALDTEEKDEA